MKLQCICRKAMIGQCQSDFTPLFEDKHKKEVVAMAVSEDLLVSLSKEQDLVIWSTRSKVTT